MLVAHFPRFSRCGLFRIAPRTGPLFPRFLLVTLRFWLCFCVCVSLAGCAKQPPRAGLPSGQATLTGTVTYLERMMLPEGAVVTVRLEDVSKVDIPAFVLGQYVNKNASAPPFTYSLTFDPQAIIPGHRYRIVARISLQGKPLWTTTEQYDVFAGGLLPPIQPGATAPAPISFDTDIIVRRVRE